MIYRKIPSTGEDLSVIGLSTYQSFDISNSQINPILENIIRKTIAAGGRLIDTSPIYGRSEQVLGEITEQLDNPNDVFLAAKVWASGLQEGIRQMETSRIRLRRKTFDLMQIHNLKDWKTHLPLLKLWKEKGIIRYIGVTHYKDAMHEELEKIIRTEKIDFVQFNYSIISRQAEKRLLPVAADHGVATIVSFPFGERNIFDLERNWQLPEWATELKVDNWRAFFLKYVISHPHVTCVIPTTNDPKQAMDYLKSVEGPLPDQAMRGKMAEYMGQHKS
jgi:diketogulonate reductase-like aldo/keto reductase